jgi:hypothetical protein
MSAKRIVRGCRFPTARVFALSVGNRVVIQKSGDGGAEEARIRSETADFHETMLVLRKGGLGMELHLECSRDDQVWRFTALARMRRAEARGALLLRAKTWP